ncbi:MAG TPA: hypothetical protein VH206_12745 [Xanthobacteraceae bacterium]|jgi:hypothetical protein|nr:hypothetical protein [Xanthobacteraceae bacterium]
MHKQLFAIVAGFIVFGAWPAYAQKAPTTPPTFRCMELPHNPDPDLPKIAPNFRSSTDLSEDEFDCLAWQDFIYMMWPATPGQRGAPNQHAKFGASGQPTVWETYRTLDSVFLPNAHNPGPWNTPQLMATLQGSPLAQQVASGAVRNLTQTSKVSRAVLANILRVGGSMPPAVLDSISQAGGGTLYDLNGVPVYYEVSMDQVQYDYILKNELFNADKQLAFAQKNVINLPMGANNNTEGAVEVKAAWKVLTDAEKKSGHFHMVDALLEGSKTKVTVGLVGFHMFIANGVQGAWATFQQANNAPAGQPAKTGTFNFFNPNCVQPGTTKPCDVNVKDADPGQVVQITPDAAAATSLNTYVHYILQQYDHNSVWLNYNLIDVQWATSPKPLTGLTPPASVPLPDGAPNVPPATADMVSPVLETFLQKPGMGCLSCHQYAPTAAVSGSKDSYAASYSFALGHATSPPK